MMRSAGIIICRVFIDFHRSKQLYFFFFLFYFLYCGMFPLLMLMWKYTGSLQGDIKDMLMASLLLPGGCCPLALHLWPDDSVYSTARDVWSTAKSSWPRRAHSRERHSNSCASQVSCYVDHKLLDMQWWAPPMFLSTSLYAVAQLTCCCLCYKSISRLLSFDEVIILSVCLLNVCLFKPCRLTVSLSML